jgi:hypothetical protein
MARVRKPSAQQQGEDQPKPRTRKPRAQAEQPALASV